MCEKLPKYKEILWPLDFLPIHKTFFEFQTLYVFFAYKLYTLGFLEAIKVFENISNQFLLSTIIYQQNKEHNNVPYNANY